MGEFLLVTIQVDMHDQLAMTLQNDLTNKITQAKARGVLIDISALDIVDSFIGRMLSNISAMAHVLDAQTVVVGMQPAVAITLVELGLDLAGVHTALDVEKGMKTLRARLDADDSSPMSSLKTETVAVTVESHIVTVRQAVRRLALEIRLSLVDQTKIVTAASELARNLLIYGGGGEVTMEILQAGVRQGLRVRFVDHGPGIADIEQALRDGYTSGHGMGLAWAGRGGWSMTLKSNPHPARARR